MKMGFIIKQASSGPLDLIELKCILPPVGDADSLLLQIVIFQYNVAYMYVMYTSIPLFH